MSVVGQSGRALSREAIWHQVECGSYAADLAAWAGIATAASGPVLELGAGTGRVSLHLARRGIEVEALDLSSELLAELAARAAAEGLAIATTEADGRAIPPLRQFSAVIAPMQFVHLLGGADGRALMLRSVRAQLSAGGRFAAAVLAQRAQPQPAAGIGGLVPDVLELDGWIYSSQPLDVVEADDGVELRRLRQIVSPEGELSEENNVVRLDHVAPHELELEAEAAGFEVRSRIDVPPTDDHVDSVICVLEAGR